MNAPHGIPIGSLNKITQAVKNAYEQYENRNDNEGSPNERSPNAHISLSAGNAEHSGEIQISCSEDADYPKWVRAHIIPPSDYTAEDIENLKSFVLEGMSYRSAFPEPRSEEGLPEDQHAFRIVFEE